MVASGILQPRGRGSRRRLLAEGFESSYGCTMTLAFHAAHPIRPVRSHAHR